MGMNNYEHIAPYVHWSHGLKNIRHVVTNDDDIKVCKEVLIEL